MITTTPEETEKFKKAVNSNVIEDYEIIGWIIFLNKANESK